jgi:hypothetical protein
MAYYLAGDYYRGRGDFLGIGGAIKKIGSTILKRVVPTLPVIGQITAGAGIIKDMRALAPKGMTLPLMPGGGAGFGFGGGGGGGMAGYTKPWPVDKRGNPRRARRDGRPWGTPTMNPANPRALRRAIRREKGFIALARRALAGTGITIGRRPSFAAKKKR